jgi:hypothetical protein
MAGCPTSGRDCGGSGLLMGESGTRPTGSARRGSPRGGPPLALGALGGALGAALGGALSALGALGGALGAALSDGGSSRCSATGVGAGVGGTIAARRADGTEGGEPSSSGAPQYLQKRVPVTQGPRQREQVTIFAGTAPDEAMSTTGAPTIFSPSKLFAAGSNRGAGGGSRRGSRAVGGGAAAACSTEAAT